MRRAFTLIEVMAVLIVLAMALGLLLVPGGVRWGAPSRQMAVTAVLDGLEQARHHAKSHGGATVRFQMRGVVVECNGSSRHESCLPKGWTCRLDHDTLSDSETLLLDARGFGPDCTIVLQSKDSIDSVRLRILGITGQAWEVHP